MQRSHVVTGGAGGVGRAIADRLAAAPDTALVVVLDRDPVPEPGPRLAGVAGDGAAEAVAAEAADRAEAAAPLRGWVNNAAVFRDLALPDAPAAAVLDAIVANLALAVVGCATAVRRFRAAGTGGAIVTCRRTRRSARSPGRCRTPRRRPRSRDSHAPWPSTTAPTGSGATP